MEPVMAGVRPMIERTVAGLPMPLRPMSVAISPGATAGYMPDRPRRRPWQVSMLDASSSEPSAMTLLLLAEIGLPHLGIGPDRLRRAGRDDAAIDQHRDAIGQREHRLHIMLDQQNGELALELAQRL